MYQSKLLITEVKIDLCNGIWVFESLSATGKTRLCQCLRALRAQDEPVFGFTYADIKLGIDLHTVLTSPDYKVVYLDRYDLYSEMEHEAIVECAKHAIVLIDCKCGIPARLDEHVCFIDMTESSIEVYS